MSFRLIRVKRRVDQEPVPALYLPVEDSKRTKIDSSEHEFRVYKIVDREQKPPIPVPVPVQKASATKSKVLLLSKSDQVNTVAEAVLVDDESRNGLYPQTDISQQLESVGLDAKALNPDFVYDLYRIDLARYNSSELAVFHGVVEIVAYDHEFIDDKNGSSSDELEDDEDSNDEDYYANDYPEEESSCESGLSLDSFEFNRNVDSLQSIEVISDKDSCSEFDTCSENSFISDFDSDDHLNNEEGFYVYNSDNFGCQISDLDINDESHIFLTGSETIDSDLNDCD